jgi:predicted amidohydrolase
MGKIALIQQNAGPDFARNVERGVEAVREAAAGGAKLVAFAEVAFSQFFPQFPCDERFGPQGIERPEPHIEAIPGPTTERFAKLAKELGVVIILNLYERDGERRFDSSPVIDADGRLLGVTRMAHVMEGVCFHEKGYYDPGDRGAPVYETAFGKVGVAICYDRHFPEYMRALGLKGAQLVVIPQAGAVDEWPEGLFEAEVRTAAFQNGYFAALVNRVGAEEKLTFAGESFVCDPNGRVMTRAPRGENGTLYADLDFALIERSAARRHFLPDRRPDTYPAL